jgi:hypothetical protein
VYPPGGGGSALSEAIREAGRCRADLQYDFVPAPFLVDFHQQWKITCAKSSVIVPETFLFLNEKEITKFSHFASILR